MTDLREMNCVACRAGEPTVTDSEIEMLQLQIPEWQGKDVDGIKRLERVFKFRNFVQTLEFTNKVGAMAEEEDHHPMIITEYGRVTVNWWTHKIKGLHKNDFTITSTGGRIRSKACTRTISSWLPRRMKCLDKQE